RDVVVLQTLRGVLRRDDQLLQPRRDVDLALLRAATRDARPPLELALDAPRERLGIGAHLLQDARREAALLLEQRGEQMLAVDLGMTPPDRQGLGFLQGLLALLGPSLGVHDVSCAGAARGRPVGGATNVPNAGREAGPVKRIAKWEGFRA